MSSTTGTVASFISAAGSLSSDSYIISDTATAIVGNLNTIVANQSKVHQLNIVLSNDDTVTGNLHSDATILYYALSTYSGSVNLALNNNTCAGGGVYESGLDMLNQLLTTYSGWTVTPFSWNPGSIAVDIYKYADMNPKLIAAISISSQSPIAVQAETYTAYNIVHYYSSNFYNTFGNKFAPLNGTLKDSALNVQTNLDALSSSPFLPTTVSFTDSTLPVVSVTQSQLTSDSRIISCFSGNYNLKVTGVTVQNLATVLGTANVTSAQVSDSAANIQADLQTGNSSVLKANFAKTSAIQISDQLVIKVSPAIASADAQVLALIVAGGGNYQVTQAASTQSGTVIQFIASAASAANSSYAIVDTAAHISANIDQLQANNAKIASVVVSDGIAVPVSSAQLISDTQVLSLITSNGGQYTVAQQGTSGNVASFISGLAQITTYTITDTASNVNASIASLISNSSKISSINLSDSGTLSLTDAQYNSGTSLWAKISSAYGLIVTGVLASEVSNLAANSHLISMTVTDTAANLASNIDTLQSKASHITAVTVSDGVNLSITASQFTADSTIIGLIPSTIKFNLSAALASQVATLSANSRVNNIAISDTAANLSSNLDVLQSGYTKISSITQSDSSTPLTLTASQYSSDSNALSFLSGSNLKVTAVPTSSLTTLSANSKVTSIALSDTASNLSASLDSIQANLKVTAISVSDNNPLTVSASQVTSDATALGLISNANGLKVNAVTLARLATISSNSAVTAIAVSDSAANISSGFDTLQANGKVTSIGVSDSNAINLTYTQYLTDTTALSSISGSYTLKISSVPASNVSSVLSNSKVTSVNVGDTAANISNNIDNLQTNISKISGVTLTGSNLINISATQYANDSGLLGLIASYSLGVTGVNAVNASAVNSDSHVVSMSVTDSAANVASAVDALQANAKLSSITISDSNLVNVTSAQFTNDSSVLAKITNPSVVKVTGVAASAAAGVANNSSVSSISISDLASNVSANLDALQSNSKISSVTVTDTNPLVITAAQYANDSAAIGKISGGYTLKISGVTTSSVASLLANSHLSSVVLSDTASNISTNVAALLANVTKISSIIVNDGNPLTLTYAQYLADSAVTALISGNYSVKVTGVAVSNLSSILSNANVSMVSINDTASNIALSLDQLQSNASKIASVIASDGGTLNITASQYTGDSTVLGSISSNYNLIVSNVAASKASSVFANTHLTSMSVSDTAANIVTSLDALQADASKISSLTISDKQVLVLSQAQVTSDAQALALVTSGGGSFIVSQNPTSWSVSGFLSAVPSLGNSKLSITDTVSNIGANLDVLQTNVAKISALTVNGTGSLSVSQARATADATLLTLFTSGGGSYTIVKPSTSGTVANFLSTLSSATSGGYAIVDTAANISAAIDSIQTNLSKVASISTSDAMACTVSQVQASNDSQALSLLVASGGNYVAAGHASTGTVASFLSSANSLPAGSYSLVDNSSNLASLIDLLQVNASKLSSVVVSDSSPIAISAQQFTNDASIINLLTGKYSLNVSNLNASNALSILQNSKVQNAVVTDTSSNIASILDGLESDISQIKSIALTDSLPFTVTQVQSIVDAPALSLIKASGGSFKILASPNNGGVANFLTQIPLLLPSSYNLLDTASNISNNFDVLKANASKLSGIYATDGQPIVLTGSQFHTAQGGLSLLSPSTSLKVTSISASDIDAAYSNPNLISMTVADTAQNIGLYLDRIQLDSNKISGLVVSDGKSLNLTQAQVTSDPLAVSLLSSSGVTIQTVPNTVTVPSTGNYNALPNQTINGIKGLSTVSFAGPASNYTLSMSGSNGTLVDSSGLYGKISLNNVQRLAFADGSEIALDLQPNQNSFNALIAASTVFGAGLAQKNFAYFVSMFDQGNSVSSVSQQIANSGLIEATLGITTANTYSNDKMWVDYVYRNVVGTNPGQSSEQYYVNFLTSGNLNRYDLLNIAINFANDPNGYVSTQTNIVGLQHQGLLFTPGPIHA
jgi:hypothetical protein